MSQQPYPFESYEELLEHLMISAVDIPERAETVMKYGKKSMKVRLMQEIVRTLREDPWYFNKDEVTWRSELVGEYREFCVENGILKEDKGDLPEPTKASKNLIIPDKPKAKKKPASKTK